MEVRCNAHGAPALPCAGACGRPVCLICDPSGYCAGCRMYQIKRNLARTEENRTAEPQRWRKRFKPSKTNPGSRFPKNRRKSVQTAYVVLDAEWLYELLREQGISQKRILRESRPQRTIEILPPGTPRSSLKRRSKPRKIRVTRNLDNRVIRRQLAMLAYLDSIEDNSEDHRTFHFQCVERQWFETVEDEMRNDGIYDLLLQIIRQYSFVNDFYAAYRKLPADAHEFLWNVYLWFLHRVLQDGDEAPCHRLELELLRTSDLAQRLTEGSWYHLSIEDMISLFAHPVTVTRIAEDPGDDVTSDYWIPMQGIQQTDPEVEAALQLLHFPKSNPATRDVIAYTPAPPNGPWGNYGGSDQSMHFAPSNEGVRGWLRERADELLAAIERGIDRLMPAPALVPALAGAGVGLGAGAAIEAPALAYIGGDGGGAGGVAQPANPMGQGGAHQPFVGVIDVGQGNCNVLFDNNGQAIVYYDFGFTKVHANEPNRGPAEVCLCHNPLIILSHWDWDHYALCRYNPKSYRLSWIVPQQHMGTTDVRFTVARILRAQGIVHLWTRRRRHMTFPWGFVTRCKDPALGQFSSKTNNSGLAICVCVKDHAGPTTSAGSAALACPSIVQATPAAAVAGYLRHATGATTVGRMQAALDSGDFYHRIDQAARAAHAAACTDPEIVVTACIPAWIINRGLGAVPADPVLIRAARAAVAAEAHTSQDWRLSAVACHAAIHASAHGVTPADLVLGAHSALASANAGNLAPAIVLAATVGTVTPGAATRLQQAASAAIAHLPPGNSDEAATGVGAGGADHGVLNAAGHYAYVAAATGGTRGDMTEAIISTYTGITKGWVKYIVQMATIPAGGGAAPLIPALQQTIPNANPPFHANERFIMSTGDNMIQFVPTQSFAPPPTMVGLVACHHGSNTADGVSMRPFAYPWAVDSREAKIMAGINMGHSLAAKAAQAAASLVDLWVGAAAAASAAVEGFAAGDGVAAVTLLAATRPYDPTITRLDAGAIAGAVGVAVGMHGGGTTANHVLAQAVLGVNPTRTIAANAAIAMHNAVVIAPTLIPANEVNNAVAVAVDIAIPTDGSAPMSAQQRNRARTLVRNAVNAQLAAPLPDSAPIEAALHGASGGAATAPEQLQFVACVIAGLLAHNAEAAGAPVAAPLGGLSKINPGQRLALVVGAAAGVAVAAAGFPVEDSTGLATLVALAPNNAAANAAFTGGPSASNIVVPFGHPNTYGHPMDAALSKYRAHGWTTRSDTNGAATAANNDRALGWEVVGGMAPYEGPLRGDLGTPGTIDRSGLCACNGVKTFTC